MNYYKKKKNMTDKTKPPISKHVVGFNLPAVTTDYIGNDIKIIVSENKNQPLTFLKISFNNGAISENKFGTAYMTGLMMTRGTKNRTNEQISEKIDYHGASLNCTAQWDDTCLNIVSVSEYFEKMFELGIECVFHPTFPEGEADKLKKKHKATIMQELADVNYLSQITFYKTIFNGHPYSHPLIGTVDSIESIDLSDIKNWYFNNFLGSKPTFIFSGNIAREKAIALVENHFSDYQVNQDRPDFHKPKKITGVNIAIANKPDASQVALRIGKNVVNRKNPDFAYLQLANTVFGGYFMSRLNKVLREEKGLTYGVFSNIENRKYSSIQMVGTNINKDNVNLAIQFIIKEYEKINTIRVTKKELFPTSQYILGSFLRSIETPQQLGSLINSLELNNLPINYFDKYYKQIANAEPEQVFEAQQKYFSPENLVIAAAGNEEELIHQLKIKN